MNTTNFNVSLFLLAFVSGALIPAQAAANAALSRSLDSTLYAAFALFAVGLLFVAAIIVFNRAAPPSIADFANAPWWSFVGGVIVGCYVLTVTFLAPRLGIATTISVIVAGQIVSAVLIDNFGLLRTTMNPISWPRILGIVLIIGGVILARRT